MLVGLTKIGNVVGYERTDQGLKAIPVSCSIADTIWRTLPTPSVSAKNVSATRKWLYLLLTG